MKIDFTGLKKTLGATVLLSLMAVCPYPQPAGAVEVAPRISDREIIESLSALKEGQKSLDARLDAMEKRFDQRFEDMEKRFDERFAAIDQRFESMEKRFNERFESMEKELNERFKAIDQRFKAVDQRFEAIDRRFDSIERILGWVLNLLSVLILGIIGLVGFVIWDRKTALRPLEKRVTALEITEEKLQNELELRHEEGSRFSRLLQALRERAKMDPELAAVLRSYSLL
uniref:Uncharacterized protein n=1 Tax=Candidatus Kentrum sp. DK TaxID=2126562 RepID=A0A450TCM5_9GAMM|nr:MAG: hypothetical protein BECKDK2373C_GA0170839_111910 [Candidatus Kentron sp. DK]